MSEKPFNIGDYIQLDDVVGAVLDIGNLSTTILTWDGIKVRVTSTELFNSNFRNYTASRVRIVRVDVQIPYLTSTEKAIDAIKPMVQWYVLEEP